MTPLLFLLACDPVTSHTSGPDHAKHDAPATEHAGHGAPADAHAGHGATPPPDTSFDARMALASPDHVPEGLNAVQNEMLLLTKAMQIAVAGVGQRDLSQVPTAFHRVHAARSLTTAAIESGAWKPAKGGITSFAAIDDAFHGSIEALLGAAQKNDVPAAAAELGAMLQACEGCHAAYR